MEIKFAPQLVKQELWAYHIVSALSLEVIKHHGLAAAAGGRPRWPDEHPDEGICCEGAQALCEAKEVGSLSTTHICSALVT